MTRRETLLQALADRFLDGGGLDESFLSEYQVTLDECYEVSETVGWAIRIFLLLPVNERARMMGRAAVSSMSAAASRKQTQ